MYKNFIVVFISVISILFFFGCSSTPEPEPEVPVEESEVVEPIVEVVEEVTSFALENQNALVALTAAREAALASEMDKEFAGLFEKLEAEYNGLVNEVGSNSSEDKTAELENLKAKYESMLKLSAAKKARARITELDFEDVDSESLVKGDDATAKADELFAIGTDGKAMLAQSEEALLAYGKVIETGFLNLCNTERDAAYGLKKQSDEIKADKADKEGYAAASLVLSGADKAYTAGTYEIAYTGFSKASKLFDEVFNRVSEKRAAAQKAIEKAKQKVDTTAVFASEADEIAPLAEEEVSE